MPPSRPTRRRSNPSAGPAIVDERTAAPSSPESAPGAPAGTGRRGRRLPPAQGPTTRVTVDLSRPDRRALGRVADALGDELAVHVPVGQVMAALAALVATDDPDGERLRTSVTAYLRDRVIE